ncbi:T9SS type A sorting domain-containing protein [Flavobacterium sp.]|uniref:T9SS type A sorting domain-containing protein n=1 Tax=Flavobacterium sp. TaxID=239 RepID=UPI0035288656
MKKLLLFVFTMAQAIVFAQGTCDTAIPVTIGTYSYGTINGTYQAGCFTTASVTSGLWYSFNSSTETVVRVNTNIAANPTTGDSRISVFDGSCAALVCVNASDDVSDTNYLTDLSFLAEANVTYYIQFDNRWGADAQNLSFEISTVDSPCDSDVPFNEAWTNQFTCWRPFDANVNGLSWSFNNGNDVDGDSVNDPIALIFPTAATNVAKDDWLISNGISLTAGITYDVEVVYNAFNNPGTANESLRVVMLDSKSPTATFNQEIGSATGIVQVGAGVSSLLPEAYASTYTFTPSSSGNYHIGLHCNTPGPGGIFMVFNVNMTTSLSAQDFFASNLKIYPNPTNDIINLSSTTTLINTVEVTDLNGRVVKSFKLNGISQTELNVSSLQSGLYFLSVETDLGKGTTKIIKN